MSIKSGKKFVAIFIAIFMAAFSFTSSAQAKTLVPGKYDYFWLIGQNKVDATIADTAYFQFSTISASYTYDISSIAKDDLIAFELGSEKVSSGAKLSESGSMVLALEINGQKVSQMDFYGSSKYVHNKIEGDTTVKVKIMQSPSEFQSSSAKNGRFGQVRIIPRIIVSHRGVNPENPDDLIVESIEDPIEVSNTTPGVSGLTTVFEMRHTGKSVKLPAATYSVFSDVEWKASAKIAKNTTITVDRIVMSAKAPSANNAKKLKITWCEFDKDFCKKKPKSTNKGYFSMGATYGNGSVYDEGKGNSLKVKVATKNVYFSQGVAVNSATTAGTVLTMADIKVTR